MGDLVKLNAEKVEDQDKIGYILDGDNKIIGVSHSDWPFDIVKKDDEIAFVSDDGEAFGVLPHNVFNDILISWLLIDAPKLVDSFANAEVVSE